MTSLVHQIDAWIISVGLVVLMVAAWWSGRQSGERARRMGRPTDLGKAADAALALMGLLLGFSFAMALQKHDHRREMTVSDSNAIGDFYTCATMLKEPIRSQLQGVIKHYAQERLEFVSEAHNDTQIDAGLKQVAARHGEMTELVHAALAGGDTVIATPLVNTLNGVTSAHASRLSAARDLLPGSVVILLVVSAMVSMSILGWQEGGAQLVSWKVSVVFALMVVLSVFVTLDLNQPRRGLIQVSQEPLERLIDSMGK